MLLSWTCNDNSVMFWDVNRSKNADKYNLNSNAHQIKWCSKEQNIFATGHDSDIKFWDRRNFQADTSAELTSFKTKTVVKQMDFDPIYGKLFMTQDRDTVRLMRVEDGKEIDYYRHSRQELMATQFLPFRDIGSPGLVLLPNRNSNFVYLQVEEGLSKTQAKQNQQLSYGSSLPFSSDGGAVSDNKAGSGSFSGEHQVEESGWNLRFQKKRAEQASVKQQNSSHDVSPDIEAFAIRRQISASPNPADDIFQVISVCQDSSIRFTTLNQPFVKEFFDKEPAILADQERIELNEITPEELGLDERQITMNIPLSPDKKTEQSWLMKMRAELQEVGELGFVKSCNVMEQKIVPRDQAESQFDGSDDEAWELTLNIHLQFSSVTDVRRQELLIEVIIPPEYPYDPLQMQLGKSYGISQHQISHILSQMPKRLHEKNPQRVGQYITLVDALWLLQGMVTGTGLSTPHSSEIGNDDYGEEPSVELTQTEGEEQSSLSPVNKNKYKGLYTPQRKRTGQLHTTPQKDNEKQFYVPYRKTCGFSWNCFGEMVYFSSPKYNFDVIKKDPSVKRFKGQDMDKLTSVEHEARFKAQARDGNESLNRHMIDLDREDPYSQQSESADGANLQDDSSYFDNQDESFDSENSNQYISAKQNNYQASVSTKRGRQDASAKLQDGYSSMNQSPDKSTNFRQKLIDDEAENFFLGRSQFSIYLHNLSHLFHINMRVAKMINTLHDDAIKNLCSENALKFMKSRDQSIQNLAKYWQMIGVALGDMNSSKMLIWNKHPLGRGIIDKVLRHFQKAKDVQQVALVAALIFGKERTIYEQQMEKIEQARRKDDAMQKRAKLRKQILEQQNSIKNKTLSDKAESERESSDQKPRTMLKTNSQGNLLQNSGSDFQNSARRNNQPVYGSLQQTDGYLDSASAVNNQRILQQYEQALGGDQEFEMDDMATPATPERKLDTIGVYDRRSGGTNLHQSNKNWRDSPGQESSPASMKEFSRIGLLSPQQKSKFKKLQQFNKWPKADKSGEQTRGSDSIASQSASDDDQNSVRQPSQLSLILSDDPQSAVVLMLYLKRYSELLFAWGERARAVEACKLVTSAYKIFTEYQQQRQATSDMNIEAMAMSIQESDPGLKTRQRIYTDSSLGMLQEVQGESQKLILAASSFWQGASSRFELHERPLNLCDYLLFSDKSLNYLQEATLKSTNNLYSKQPMLPHEQFLTLKAELEQQQPNRDKTGASFTQNTVLKPCSVCHLSARGIVYYCRDCGHGGCFEHLVGWVSQHTQTQAVFEPDVKIQCPLGCGCTTCFVDENLKINPHFIKEQI